MSSNTWTPPAVASEAFRARRRLWRAVEAQHIAATLRLVAGLDEQAVLERLLDETKPPLAGDTTALHYLLATPFRYVSPVGSRFRAPAAAGIWYGAEARRTACAELGFWRWRFLMDSDALTSLGPSPQTLFKAGIDARMVDLSKPPLRRSRAEWTHPDNYAATKPRAPLEQQTWLLTVRRASVVWQCEAQAFEFDAGSWQR